jgi:hypothetical protein
MSDNRNGYKAYSPGLVCRGKQYAENTTFEESGGELCGSGMMHYCVNPFDCLDYYPLIVDDGSLTEFTDVTAEEKPVVDGKKYATRKLHVGVRLDLKGFIKAAFEFLWESAKIEDSKVDEENSAKLAASGDYAKLAASGDYAKLAASGYSAKLAASGDSAQLAASGYYAKLAASGDSAKLAASGDSAKLAASGDDSIVAGIGIENVAKAAIGCWIVLAEWAHSEIKQRYVPACVKAAKIDGEILKADTWYVLKNGEFVEVTDDE